MTLYFSYTAHFHWEKRGQWYRDLSALQLHINLQLSQNKKLNLKNSYLGEKKKARGGVGGHGFGVGEGSQAKLTPSTKRARLRSTLGPTAWSLPLGPLAL